MIAGGFVSRIMTTSIIHWKFPYKRHSVTSSHDCWDFVSCTMTTSIIHWKFRSSDILVQATTENLKIWKRAHFKRQISLCMNASKISRPFYYRSCCAVAEYYVFLVCTCVAYANNLGVECGHLTCHRSLVWILELRELLLSCPGEKHCFPFSLHSRCEIQRAGGGNSNSASILRYLFWMSDGLRSLFRFRLFLRFKYVWNHTGGGG